MNPTPPMESEPQPSQGMRMNADLVGFLGSIAHRKSSKRTERIGFPTRRSAPAGSLESQSRRDRGVPPRFFFPNASTLLSPSRSGEVKNAMLSESQRPPWLRGSNVPSVTDRGATQPFPAICEIRVQEMRCGATSSGVCGLAVAGEVTVGVEAVEGRREEILQTVRDAEDHDLAWFE